MLTIELAPLPTTAAGWTMTNLAVVGIFALMASLTALFSSWGEKVRRLSVTSAPRPQSPQLLTSAAHLMKTSVQHGLRPRILQNGNGFLPALREAIENANHSINILTYVWQRSEASSQILQALIRKAQAGVEVRLLVDGNFGTILAPQAEFAQLKNHGGQVEFFRPPIPGKLTRYHRRTHRRSFVIDGRTAFLGGIGINDQWLMPYNPSQSVKNWRDLMFAVEGTMAHHVQSAFADLWAGATGEILAGQLFYAPTAPSAQETIPFFHVATTPFADTSSVSHLLYLLFASARKRILIASPFLTPYQALLDLLSHQAKSGLTIDIILPYHLDVSYVRAASHAYYAQLLQAGANIHEYQPSYYHTKAITIDDTISLIGSPNLDIRSTKFNHENFMVLQDQEFTHNLTACLRQDREQSKQVTLEEWKHRPLYRKALEQTAKIFAEQY